MAGLGEADEWMRTGARSPWGIFWSVGSTRFCEYSSFSAYTLSCDGSPARHDGGTLNHAASWARMALGPCLRSISYTLRRSGVLSDVMVTVTCTGVSRGRREWNGRTYVHFANLVLLAQVGNVDGAVDNNVLQRSPWCGSAMVN